MEGEGESHDNHVTTQPAGETTAMNSDLLNYENGYQEQQDKVPSGSGFVSQPSSTQEPTMAHPPSPVPPSPMME